MTAVLGWALILYGAVVLHELCHGLAAYTLGDSTAKEAGRLTLNPLKHIDVFWTILLPVLIYFLTAGQFVFAMAKPVPVNFSRLYRPKTDMIWVALAGPFANFLIAFVLNYLLHMSYRTGVNQKFLTDAIYFNIMIALFNLFPLPPLDGSKILAGLLPLKWAVPYLETERYSWLLIFVFYFLGIIPFWIVTGIYFFSKLLGLPVGG